MAKRLAYIIFHKIKTVNNIEILFMNKIEKNFLFISKKKKINKKSHAHTNNTKMVLSIVCFFEFHRIIIDEYESCSFFNQLPKTV